MAWWGKTEHHFPHDSILPGLFWQVSCIPPTKRVYPTLFENPCFKTRLPWRRAMPRFSRAYETAFYQTGYSTWVLPTPTGSHCHGSNWAKISHLSSCSAPPIIGNCLLLNKTIGFPRPVWTALMGRWLSRVSSGGYCLAHPLPPELLYLDMPRIRSGCKACTLLSTTDLGMWWYWWRRETSSFSKASLVNTRYSFAHLTWALFNQWVSHTKECVLVPCPLHMHILLKAVLHI